MIYSLFRFGNKVQKSVKKSVILDVNGLIKEKMLTECQSRESTGKSAFTWHKRSRAMAVLTRT